MSEEKIKCPKCGTENSFDSSSQNKLYCQECRKDLTKYVIAENTTPQTETMSEQTVLCVKCGQQIPFGSDFCPFCGQSTLKQSITKTEDSEDTFNSMNILGYFVKLLVFIGVPAYFLYLGHNMMFKTTETASSYGMDYILLKQGITLQYFTFGIGIFLLLFLLITIIYAEIILKKLSNIDKK